MTREGPSWFNVTSVILAFCFLWLPMLLLVGASFNDSRLVTVWGGFSTRWYAALIGNGQMLSAALISVAVAFCAATAATVLGTLAAVAMVWRRPSAGRSLLSTLILAPLVVPEVITGLSILLLFVALGMERGFLTLWLAHLAFTTSFAAVAVRSRLVTADRILDEAARDLGVGPVEAFLRVTLPTILPGVGAGWLLAFILSFDNLVVSSFTTGPGATTLPMRIASAARLGVSPEINALFTIMLAALGVMVIAALLVQRRRDTRHDR